MIDAQLPDIIVKVNIVRAQTERRLPLHPQPTPYGTHPKRPLQETLKERTQEPDPATVAGPSKICPTDMRGLPPIEEEGVVKKKTIHLLIDLDSGADLRYSAEERSDTDKKPRGNGYSRKTKSDEKISWRDVYMGETH